MHLPRALASGRSGHAQSRSWAAHYHAFPMERHVQHSPLATGFPAAVFLLRCYYDHLSQLASVQRRLRRSGHNDVYAAVTLTLPFRNLLFPQGTWALVKPAPERPAVQHGHTSDDRNGSELSSETTAAQGEEIRGTHHTAHPQNSGEGYAAREGFACGPTQIGQLPQTRRERRPVLFELLSCGQGECALRAAQGSPKVGLAA